MVGLPSSSVLAFFPGSEACVFLMVFFTFLLLSEYVRDIPLSFLAFAEENVALLVSFSESDDERARFTDLDGFFSLWMLSLSLSAQFPFSVFFFFSLFFFLFLFP